MKGELIDLGGFRLGGTYSRLEMAEAGRVRLPTDSRDPHWSSGIVQFDNAVLLLVTLEKTDYTYQDSFDGDVFWWQSQNKQTQNAPVLRRLGTGEIPAFLFARIAAKQRGKTRPFVYCGMLSTPAMEGSNPVTCLLESIDFIEGASADLDQIYQWRPGVPPSKEEAARRTLALSHKPSRSRSKGQGRLLDHESRKAIELHAMQIAIEHYRADGYEVVDTSLFRPFDLLCTKREETRRVEVKGTQTPGLSVELTAGEVDEVQRGRDQGISTDLFIVHSISLTRSDGGITLDGGEVRKLHDWTPLAENLSPTMFRYQVPDDSPKPSI